MPFTNWLVMMFTSITEGRATFSAVMGRMEEGLLVHPLIGIP